MKKKYLNFLLAMFSYVSLFGQNPGLVTMSSDMIDFTSFPTAPLLVESGPENFYWIGGAFQGTSVNHPLLSGKVLSDVSNIFFIRYDKMGKPLSSAVISGTNTLPSAFSMDGGLTLVGNAYNDVLANGNTIPIRAADRMEFIAKYNDLCQFERIVPVWDLDPAQYPSSRAMMDTETGDLYLAGVSYQPLNLIGYGLIGKGMSDYLYVLKYDRNLVLTGVFTAGFDEENSEYGYYEDLRITPGGKGSVIITGTWVGDRTPVIDGDTLKGMVNSQGVFALKLNEEFRKDWVLEGMLNGYDYDGFSGISEGMSLTNGDLVMVGASSTGHFSLGEVKIEYANGAGTSNMFAFRLSPEGKPRWIKPFENRDDAYDIGKKGAGSEEFTSSMEWDAIRWKEEVLYLVGKFTGDLFAVAGRSLENKMGKGIFVAALDMRSGEEKWGYSLSSDRTDLHGFDLDGSGNVSLMGRTGSVQEYEGFGNVTLDGTDLIFHLGLDNLGKPLWYNNAYNVNLGYNTYGCDLEVLKGGEVFSTFYKTVFDPMLIGGASLSSKDIYSTLLVGLSADNMVGGKITDKFGDPLYPGVVKAYKITSIGAYPLVQTIDLDNTGAYLFTRLPPGNYALVSIPDRDTYPDGMPTYAGGGITWSATQTDAYDIATDTRATFLNISLSHLDPLTESDGSGKMSGNISYADDFITKGTMARPVTQTAVILKKKASSKGTQEEDIVAYIETDGFGNYYFDFVPDGEYNMIVDVPGLPMEENYDVEILDNTIVGELDFVVKNDGIYTPSTGIESVEMKLVSIYPNPGNGNLSVEFRKSGDYRVRVFNTVGKMIEYKNYLSVSGTVDLDLSELDSGIYLIKIESDKGSETMKYVRN